jgi:hypothetical protein
MVRRFVLVAWLASLCLAQAGCTFFACSGGGPLTRAELGDWAGIAELDRPERAELTDLRERRDWGTWRICGTTFKLDGDRWSLCSLIPPAIDCWPFTPAPGFELRGRFPICRRLIPSARDGLILYVSQQGGRDFYAVEKEWDAGRLIGLLIGEYLVAGDTANAYDAGSHERVAARKVNVLLGLGGLYTRYRRVLPVDEHGRKGLRVFSDGALSPSRARYDLRDGTVSLLGLIGWGRVNRTRYLQLLWIPIPIGKVKI